MPRPHLRPTTLTFAALAMVTSCATSEEKCASPSPFPKAVAGVACTAGPTDCEPGLACRGWNGDASTSEGAVCGACTAAIECPELDGCTTDGLCGACEADAQCREGEACLLGFCLPEEVPVWDLELDTADWQKLHDDWYSDYYYDCKLTVDGTEYEDGCEVRPYGSTSRTYPKKSLRIRFPEDTEHPGYSRKITLRAEYNDPTYLRTFLSYETFRRLTPLPTPRTRFVELQVNGETYGLMLELERNGPKYLEENGRDRDLPMFEAERAPPWGGMMPMACPDEYAFYNGKELYNQKSGGDEDINDLQRLIEDVLWQDYQDSEGQLWTSLERTRRVVDLDPHVSYLAVQGLLQNRDHVAANYHVALQSQDYWENHFLPESSRPTVDPAAERLWWEVHPYDLDTTFGCVYNPEAQNNICDQLESEIWWLNGVLPDDEPVGYPHEQWGNLLAHLVLKNQDCRLVFNDRLTDYAESDWWNERLPYLAVALEQHLIDAVKRDPNDLNTAPGLTDWSADIDRLLQFIPARAAYLKTCVDSECK
jgi:hypothetical protein